ncbi:hypothetical protein B0H16DRAFT_1886966 [Mycena metata]|uniref:Uncharacterized protein n=1 Tax=Mycena metata TaxID=1033252 RepID=A0AAD7IZ19_9AGAR|nr:hypothetical protein B0H16DRAFT_1886966 [Mycena metata]
MSCPTSGGPPMNTNISGIGVRLSFYLQTLFLGCLTIRSPSLDEVAGAFCTLLATNTGMAVTALILGFKPTPEISFHDALVVFYLLNISWFTVFFALPSRVRFPGRGNLKMLRMLHVFSVIQSYTLFAFALAMLCTAETFGSNPGCNANAVVVLFRPFPAIKRGQILFLVLTGLVVMSYTALIVRDISRPTKRLIHRTLKVVLRLKPEQPPTDDAGGLETTPLTGSITPHLATTPALASASAAPEHVPLPKYIPLSERATPYDPNIEWMVVFKVLSILILWGLAVMNTELLIQRNHFAPSDDSHSQWQFGQCYV